MSVSVCVTYARAAMLFFGMSMCCVHTFLKSIIMFNGILCNYIALWISDIVLIAQVQQTIQADD